MLGGYLTGVIEIFAALGTREDGEKEVSQIQTVKKSNNSTGTMCFCPKTMLLDLYETATWITHILTPSALSCMGVENHNQVQSD